MKTHRRAATLSLLGGLLSAGCGNVTPGGVGAATVVVSGDHQPATPSPSMAALALASPPAPSSHGNQPEGEIQAKFSLFLVSESGAVTRLGPEEIEVHVDLQGKAEGDAVRDQPVAATLYTELRIIFTDIKVEVEGGLVVNGVTILGEVRVELDDVALLVTRPISLDVPPDGSVVLVMDLNGPAWLEALDPTTTPYTIDESVFATLVDVVIR